MLENNSDGSSIKISEEDHSNLMFLENNTKEKVISNKSDILNDEEYQKKYIEEQYKDFYKNFNFDEDALILDDCSVNIEDINKCIYEIKDDTACDPFNMKCDKSCEYSKDCIYNYRSGCYNMSISDFKIYVEEAIMLDQYCKEFLSSEECEHMIKELTKDT